MKVAERSAVNFGWGWGVDVSLLAKTSNNKTIQHHCAAMSLVTLIECHWCKTKILPCGLTPSWWHLSWNLSTAQWLLLASFLPSWCVAVATFAQDCRAQKLLCSALRKRQSHWTMQSHPCFSKRPSGVVALYRETHDFCGWQVLVVLI